MPTPFHATALTLSLTVKELQKSLAWYTDVIGFEIDRKIERDGVLRGVALKSGDIRLTINQDDGAKGWERIKGLGFSIRITTDTDIDAFAARIKQQGGKLDLEPTDMSWGVRLIRLTDPDGYKISVSMPKK
ncbi:MAG TPA: VOC family protein [Bacteroidota bacterium]|nr:VOC family protein [Bacteroidota bacterium]